MEIAIDVGVNKLGERIMKYEAGFTFQGTYDEFNNPREGIIKDLDENIIYVGEIQGDIIQFYNQL